MADKLLQLDSRDNVLVALTDLKQGEQIDFSGKTYTLVSNVPAKHKFAIQDLAIGDDVIMYGVVVGRAAKPISQGQALTTSNVQHQASDFHEQSGAYSWQAPDVSRWQNRTFLGYLRPDGQVGTRNYWLVVPLVFCENRNIGVLKQAFEEELGFAAPQVYRRQVAELAKLYRDGRLDNAGTPGLPGNGSGQPRSQVDQNQAGEKQVRDNRVFQNIDGIKFLLHEGGCGGTREDSNNLCGLIAGYINHPNVAGATVLSLGCQNAQVGMLRQQIEKRNPNLKKPVIVLEQQQKRHGIHHAFGRHPPDIPWAGRGRQGQAHAGGAFSSLPGPEMWRIGRIFRHLGQSCHRAHRRSPGSARGPGDSF